MHEPRGHSVSLTAPRRFIIDLLHFAKRVPSVPVSREMDVRAVVSARASHPTRPSWALIFMKAYALVCEKNPPLRRALVTFPWARLYEHPISVCALALEREYQGEEGIFVGLFRGPEVPSLVRLQEPLDWYRKTPLHEIGFYRQALRVSRLPWPARWLLWWSTLNVSGFKRAKRFGTFGLSSYGSLGAESLHPISPLTTTLTYGPIDANGRICVKLIYDHRVLDGAYVARRLQDLEETLNGVILEELRRGVVEEDHPAATPRIARAS